MRTEPEALGDMRVGSGAAHDPVLRREPHRLLVEGADRDPRVEDLDRVDVLDHGEQVLVVGHGVQAVERVRHVDEAALGADRRDRLVERHPARDLLLDEEADHLALVGGLDLLRHDHLDPELGRLGAGVERAGDLVVVGHRDRAEAGVAGGGQQHLDRRRAVARVVGVHVQVDVDQLALGQPRPHRGEARGDVAPRGDLLVDRLEALRHARPVESSSWACARSRRVVRRPSSRISRSSWAASVSTSPGSNSSPRSSSPLTTSS